MVRSKESTLKEILLERERWNFLDFGQVAARIGIVDGETCFVPYTLAMKKIFPDQNLPIKRIVNPGMEIRFSRVLCEDKFFLGLIEKFAATADLKSSFEPDDFPWDVFMRIVEVEQQHFVVERKNYLWRVNNLALTNIGEIALRLGEQR